MGLWESDLQKALNGTHRRTSQCNQGADRKRQKLAAEKEREVTVRAFSAYGLPLENVTSFRYLGRVISAADDNWLAVARKFYQARAVWRRMMRILSREEAAPWVSGLFFKAEVHAVLLFRLETWVATPLHGQGCGGSSVPGGEMADGKAPAEDTRREVDIHLGGEGTG